MKKVVLLGASSQISQYLIPRLLSFPEIQLTLFSSHVQVLKKYQKTNNVTIIKGNRRNSDELVRAITGQDIVYLATSQFEKTNRLVVKIMKKVGGERLIVAGGLGIYDEVAGKFGEWNANMMGDYTIYKNAAAVIDNSGLNYTFLRMTWLYDQDGNEAFEIVPKGEPLKGTQVTRQAIAKLVTEIIQEPTKYSKQNIGVVEPDTEWDKPSFY